MDLRVGLRLHDLNISILLMLHTFFLLRLTLGSQEAPCSPWPGNLLPKSPLPAPAPSAFWGGGSSCREVCCLVFERLLLLLLFRGCLYVFVVLKHTSQAFYIVVFIGGLLKQMQVLKLALRGLSISSWLQKSISKGTNQRS